VPLTLYSQSPFLGGINVKTLLGFIAAATISVTTNAVAQAPADAAATAERKARMLAANCAQCHGTNGKSAGGAVPGLAGRDRTYFIEQMKAFKEGKREATLMHQISKGYTDEEVALMADYFAKQKQ
jgi:cytochrome subunit of sulfide dehydrogenase